MHFIKKKQDYPDNFMDYLSQPICFFNKNWFYLLIKFIFHFFINKDQKNWIKDNLQFYSIAASQSFHN